MTKYAILAAAGVIAMVFFVNLAGWSFFALSKNTATGWVQDIFGVSDENTQLLVVVVIFLGMALLIATVTGVSAAKVLQDFLK